MNRFIQVRNVVQCISCGEHIGKINAADEGSFFRMDFSQKSKFAKSGCRLESAAIECDCNQLNRCNTFESVRGFCEHAGMAIIDCPPLRDR